MESLELGRKLKRNCENIVSKKRLALIVIVGLVTIFYIFPYLIQWYRTPTYHVDKIEECLRDRLTPFTNLERDELNAYVGYLDDQTKSLVAYSGNGYFGLDVGNSDQLYLKLGRNLNVPSGIFPILKFDTKIGLFRSAFAINYQTGIVHLFRCYNNGFYVSSQFYSHRRKTNLLVHEVKLSNPSDLNVDVGFSPSPISSLRGANSRSVTIKEGDNYNITNGYIAEGSETNQRIPISVVQRSTPIALKIDARSSKNIVFFTGVEYGNRHSLADQISKIKSEKALIEIVKLGAEDTNALKEQHAQAWHNLWTTGFSIETSKAKEALNGDKINATVYYVLSQIQDVTDLSQVVNTLSYSEGCYGNHHTLEAPNLWSSLDSVADVNKVVAYWLLTLEKNGCHKMVKVGARGVAEAMVLSFGGLRFSNQHLEFNIDPKYLHRGCQFNRIAYGNSTHVNISVVVQEDNKAILRVAVDRSDKKYYACDAGCLDPPVLLAQEPVSFPVKLTEPLTPILYVTYDKQHMEELRQAIHVREIGVAPAHEHHVIALHKHGHHLGGLPTFFWVSVSILILIFHLFLFKLIYNEYCASNAYDRQRFRYGKL